MSNGDHGAAVNGDEWPEAVYDAAEKALKPYVDRIPPECDSHGRNHVAECDGQEYCQACYDEEFSGELSHFAADSVAIEVIRAVRAALAAMQRTGGDVPCKPWKRILTGEEADDHPDAEDTKEQERAGGGAEVEQVAIALAIEAYSTTGNPAPANQWDLMEGDERDCYRSSARVAIAAMQRSLGGASAPSTAPDASCTGVLGHRWGMRSPAERCRWCINCGATRDDLGKVRLPKSTSPGAPAATQKPDRRDPTDVREPA